MAPCVIIVWQHDGLNANENQLDPDNGCYNKFTSGANVMSCKTFDNDEKFFIISKKPRSNPRSMTRPTAPDRTVFAHRTSNPTEIESS